MNACIACASLAALVTLAAHGAEDPVSRPFDVKIKSSVDGTDQPALVQVPEGYDPANPAPLLVGLHTWSGHYPQQAKAMGPRANKRGWLLVLPNFRGPNKPNNPAPRQACASILAQHDVMDAVHYMRTRYNVDADRIYLAGASGGGHMAQIMAGKYPHVWAAVTAWVGISDLRKWQAENKGYAPGVHACTGGRPGDSPEVDWEYLRRSPVTFIQNASNTWLDIQHGRHDKSVAFHHSVDSYGLVSQVPGHRARLTVFDGGHTIKYGLALNWLAAKVRDRKPPRTLWLTTDEAKAYFYAHLTPAAPRRLGMCRIEIEEGPTLAIEVKGLMELRIDTAAAGLAEAGAIAVRYQSDGLVETLVIGPRRIDAKGKTSGQCRVEP